jgi:hypothetical protein
VPRLRSDESVVLPGGAEILKRRDGDRDVRQLVAIICQHRSHLWVGLDTRDFKAPDAELHRCFPGAGTYLDDDRPGQQRHDVIDHRVRVRWAGAIVVSGNRSEDARANRSLLRGRGRF